MKEFINTRIKVEEKFTRKNMFNYVYSESFNVWSKVHTLDNYRACLMKVEILDVTDKKGIYIKLQNIPEDLKLNKLKQIAYDHTWRKWFIPMKDKL